MIPVDTHRHEVDTLPGEEIEFGIGDPRWIMRTNTKLYSNSALATIREVSTNGRDAMDEAGKEDEPLIVTLPTTMNPYFEVQDYGIGMSLDDLKTYFTKFGNSSKRHSNKFNGMLGYGSKAPLAYTDSFTITCVKDGIETVGVVSKKADYSITLKVVMSSATDAPNGVKVTVPVHEATAFRQVAHDFYRFWLPGTVLVDGEHPEWAVGDKLDDNLFYSTSRGTSYVVMGNVPYRIANPDALFRNRKMHSISFVAYVPNGSVEFTPSREDLEYTDSTKKTLESVIDNFEKKMVAEAKRDIDSATDYFEAYSKWSHWTSTLGDGPFGNLEFKGEKFQSNIELVGYRYRPAEARYNTYKVHYWTVNQARNTLFVVDFSPVSPASHHKAKVREYLNTVYLPTTSTIMFVEAKSVDSPWVDSKRIVTWEQVKQATKKPPMPRGSHGPRRIRGTFDYYTKNGFFAEKELPADVSTNLYYMTVAQSKTIKAREVLTHFNDDGMVVVLAANRINKFQRDNPKAIDFIPHFMSKVEFDGSKLLDADTKAAMCLAYEVRQWLRALPVEKIDDPRFAQYKRLLTRDTNKSLAQYNDMHQAARVMGAGYRFKSYDVRAENRTLLADYPLLDAFRYNSHIDELVFYINAKYATKKEK